MTNRSAPGSLAGLDGVGYHAVVHPLTSQVGREIVERRLLQDGQCVLVAVSGGCDSMVLLDVLRQLSVRHGWRLVLAHLDHGLRGAESKGDAEFVREEAARLGLDSVIERVQVEPFARDQGMSIEMAARLARHRFLIGAARAAHSTTVAMGHHRDDQVELFFLRLFRGAGGEGLEGMNWSGPSPVDKSIRLVRPLLNQSRETILSYARLRRLRYRHDHTNARLDVPRNRVRHRLLPLMRREYQEALDHTLVRTMDIVGAEADYARQTAERWLGRDRRARFEGLHLAVQRAAIRRQLWDFGIEGDFRLVETLRCQPDRPVTASSGLAIVRNKDGILRRVIAGKIEFRPGEPMVVPLSGKRGKCVFGDVTICWERIAGQGIPGRRSFRPGVELFDAGKVGDRVILRHWQPGDRLRPIGLSRPVKLQDLFVNAGIGREKRRQLIVALNGAGEVFWVEGLRIGEGFKLENQSRYRLRWQWHRSGQRG